MKWTELNIICFILTIFRPEPDLFFFLGVFNQPYVKGEYKKKNWILGITIFLFFFSQNILIEKDPLFCVDIWLVSYDLSELDNFGGFWKYGFYEYSNSFFSGSKWQLL